MSFAVAADSKADDPRLGSIITNYDETVGGNNNNNKSPTLVLLGFPCDEGVRRNGGRVGAAGGPDAVRKQLKKMGTVYNPEYDVDLSTIKIADAGNIAISGDNLEEFHTALRSRVAELVQNGSIPFVIGGGNDQSYPNAAGLLDVKSKSKPTAIGVMNIDAHFDVRPLLSENRAHSGSPFRQLLEDPRFDGHYFVEFASQGNQCALSHLQYLHSKHANVVWLSQLRTGKHTVIEAFNKWLDTLSETCSDIFISFDIDAIIGSDAPGVSAVATIGLSSLEALDICFAAGRCENVSLFDVSEFNPMVEDHRTARLVTNMFYYFAMGVATRKSRHGQNRI